METKKKMKKFDGIIEKAFKEKWLMALGDLIRDQKNHIFQNRM